MLFDSWAGLLGPEAFDVFSLPYMARIARSVKAAHPDVPFAVFARGANHALGALSDGPFDVVGLDCLDGTPLLDIKRARPNEGSQSRS